jgi:hypothetical protein
MPESCSIDFSNKYGNMDLQDLQNDARIDVKYGNLTMGDLEGDLALSLGYGNAFVGSVKDAALEVAYSKFRCEEANDVALESKYSMIRINQAERLSSESKYDNYELGKIASFANAGKYDNFILDACGELIIDTKYTDLKLGSLTEKLVANLNYGGISVEALEKGFEEVLVNTKYANVTLIPAPGAGYELDLSSKYVGIKVPELKDLQEEKDGSTHNIRYSQKGSSKGSININMEYGEFRMK